MILEMTEQKIVERTFVEKGDALPCRQSDILYITHAMNGGIEVWYVDRREEE